jgi:hypothetical protein
MIHPPYENGEDDLSGQGGWPEPSLFAYGAGKL